MDRAVVLPAEAATLAAGEVPDLGGDDEADDGVSVTPLMRRYERWRGRGRAALPDRGG